MVPAAHRPARPGTVTLVAPSILVAALLVTAAAAALAPKEARDQLDLLAFSDPALRVVEVNVDASEVGEALPRLPAMAAFRSAQGEAWRFTVDLRRGVTSLLDGGAAPFIPGRANRLEWNDFAPGCRSYDCLPVATVEGLARSFLDQHAEALGFGAADLVLDPEGSGPFGDTLYFLRFQWTVAGIPVEGASVYVRVNSGNLIQVASENVGPTTLDPRPALDAAAAATVLADFLGPFARPDDRLVDPGSLVVVPVTPAGQDPDRFRGPVGSGLDYRLAWRLAFDRKDVIGAWEALVDAHTGELLRFVDTNRYGRIRGGAYPGDNHVGEADRPFPFADTGLPAPHQYADAGGLFPGDSATSMLRGKYARINDSCGAISGSTTAGDIDFGLGPGTDCAVPPGNTGGPGNTHSARTQYYHLTIANLRAQAWLPGNTWLQSSYITVNTNQSPWCNAQSGGDTLYFFRADSGCWNLGEIPGVAVHEWGHSLDNFDGSGGQSRPVETYADWMAALHLHDSCIGRGFFLTGNCSGYGDPCTSCNGIRDLDYTQHQRSTPWTAANFGSVWSCSTGSYNGPCGLSDHCESGISSQALWDFVNRKLTGPPHNLDLRSAWLLADRLWYLGIPTLGSSMYTCSRPNSDGCGGASLFNVMRAVDDDGDGTANGTPHAAAIYAALADHNIACGAAGDPSNQSFTSCPSLLAPTLSAEGQSNSAVLGWSEVAGAARYAVFRSDIGCDAGMTRIAIVNAPATGYTDATVVNDIEYYYLVQALGTADACFGPVSACAAVTPVLCTAPAAPSSLVATPSGANQIAVSWSSSDPGAASFSVYRAVGACPQVGYQLVASGLATTSFLDTTASGGLDYAYVVTAKDVTGGCESAAAPCAQAQTTGDCVEPPAFTGLEAVSNLALATCTLELSWSPATAYCGGPARYNVHRSTTPGFVPSPANRIAGDLEGTGFSDAAGLDFGESRYYVVRAVDGGNAVEEQNTVEVSGAPTGPITVGAFADDAGDTGAARLTPTAPWSVVTSGGHDGPKAYATGSYGNNLCVAVTSEELRLGSDPQLTFWSKYGIESGWDKGEVQISTDGGSSWARAPVNYPTSSSYQADACGLPTGTYFTGTNSTYAQYSASLSTWAHQDVTVRWVLSSDTSLNGNGWWVDDIVITDVEVPSSCETGGSTMPTAFGKSRPADGAPGQTLSLGLEWAGSTNATDYLLCVDTIDNGACDGAWTGSNGATAARLGGLDALTTYFWQVRAVNASGQVDADGGQWWSFTTDQPLFADGFEDGGASAWSLTMP